MRAVEPASTCKRRHARLKVGKVAVVGAGRLLPAKVNLVMAQEAAEMIFLGHSPLRIRHRLVCKTSSMLGASAQNINTAAAKKNHDS